MMFLAENSNIQCGASIAFDHSNTLWAKPKPKYVTPKAHTSLRGTPKQAERARVQGENPYILALFVFCE